MSSRNRPRVNHNQDADEERRLWSQIKADAKRVDTMVAKSATIGTEIVELENKQAALLEADQLSDATIDERLESLYRENVRISEQVQHIIEGRSDDMNLLDSIKVLQGLREASEESSQASSNVTGRRDASANPKGRSTAAAAVAVAAGPKRKAPLTDDGEEGSAAPSPRVSGGRLAATDPAAHVKQRGGSAQPSTREVSVKIEDGDSVTSSVEGGSGNGNKLTPSSDATTRLRLYLNVGAMVFYRNKGRAAEGEGILCKVTNVIGDGKQRRYEVQDADPDPQQGTGPYRASVNHLVSIPSTNAGLPDLPKGKHVLAQYPDTTTFYKAEVSTAWRNKDAGSERGTPVRLRFEGEQEEAKETEVERRFVLLDK